MSKFVSFSIGVALLTGLAPAEILVQAKQVTSIRTASLDIVNIALN